MSNFLFKINKNTNIKTNYIENMINNTNASTNTNKHCSACSNQEDELNNPDRDEYQSFIQNSINNFVETINNKIKYNKIEKDDVKIFVSYT
jgi:3-oxoacyl-[acyl-carrier-protein] synthase III